MLPNRLPKVLFVDDEPNLLEGLKRSLHKMQGQWRMSFCDSARLALDACSRENFDLVVTDLRMPEIDGITLVKQLNQAHPEISCIMLTGTADLNDAAELINTTNISGFFTKPCEPTELIEGIAHTLEKKSRSRSDIPDMERLKQRYNLTPAEARLTHSLLTDGSLEKAAENNGVTISSARTYLKRVFAKTGTNKQAELIRKLITENA